MADVGNVQLPQDVIRPTPQDVIRAYMLILGRPPESEDTIALQCKLPDIAALGDRLIRSAEFRLRHGHELAQAQPELPVPRPAPGSLVGVAALDFAAGGNAGGVLGEGWSKAEPDGRWAVDGGSTLRITDVPAHEEYLLRLWLKPFAAPRALAIEAGGITILDQLVTADTVLSLRIAGELVGPDRTLSLRLRHPRASRPCDLSASGDERFLAVFVRRAVLEAIDRGGAPPSPYALAPGFESLGVECDFGLYEGKIGHEPPSLFRYSSVALPALAAAIETRFDGFPQPLATEIVVGRNGEYLIRDTALGLRGHTGARVSAEMPVDEAALLQRQLARLRFLKRLLNQRLDVDGTIFVYRSSQEVPLSAVLPLWQAIRRRGDNALLWVSDAGPERPCGTVELIEDGLLHGAIDPWTERTQVLPQRVLAWSILCRRALRLWAPRSVSG